MFIRKKEKGFFSIVSLYFICQQTCLALYIKEAYWQTLFLILIFSFDTILTFKIYVSKAYPFML